MNEKISLIQLLASRDDRVAHQRELISAFDATLVSFMVNMPGEIKYCTLSEALHREGVRLLKERLEKESLPLLYSEVRLLETGIEGYFVVSADPEKVKRLCCIIEDTHPLGRLFDFDVISDLAPMSRTELGFEPRGCIVCGRPGSGCARSRAHSPEEIIAKMQAIYEDYCKTQN